MKTYRNRIAIFLLIAIATAGVAAPAAAAEGVVNVNAAGADELALLPRIGPALAQRIIDFREENGPFEHPEDLILVRGIGEKTFALMEPYVALEGKTTLDEKVRGVTATRAASDGDDGDDGDDGEGR